MERKRKEDNKSTKNKKAKKASNIKIYSVGEQRRINYLKLANLMVYLERTIEEFNRTWSMERHLDFKMALFEKLNLWRYGNGETDKLYGSLTKLLHNIENNLEKQNLNMRITFFMGNMNELHDLVCFDLDFPNDNYTKNFLAYRENGHAVRFFYPAGYHLVNEVNLAIVPMVPIIVKNLYNDAYQQF